MSKILKTDDVKDLEEYKVISQIIREMQTNGILTRLQGNCVGACDLLSSMLLHQGIESKIVECYVSIKNNNTTPPQYTFIGYDGLAHKEQVDVHTVVVTNTKHALLIDLSIQNALTETTSYIIGTTKSDPNILAEYFFDGLEVRYNFKKHLKLPSLHQKNILQRIKEEEEIREKLKLLQTGILIIGTFAAINFTLNMIAVILKIIYL